MNSDDRYDSLLRYYAGLVEYDWLLLKAQIKAESNFNPHAVSRVGARGLAQFVDATWREWEDGTPGIQPETQTYNPEDPEDCIRAQSHYMKWLLWYCGGDQQYALAAYNWGVGRIHPFLNVKTPFANAVSSMPPETQDYVKRILGFYNQYKSTVVA